MNATLTTNLKGVLSTAGAVFPSAKRRTVLTTRRVADDFDAIAKRVGEISRAAESQEVCTRCDGFGYIKNADPGPSVSKWAPCPECSNRDGKSWPV
jgi:hypothetical protein